VAVISTSTDEFNAVLSNDSRRSRDVYVSGNTAPQISFWVHFQKYIWVRFVFPKDFS